MVFVVPVVSGAGLTVLMVWKQCVVWPAYIYVCLCLACRVEAVMHEPEQAMLGAMLDSYSRYLQGPLRAADHDSPSPVQASPVPAVLQYCRVPGPTQYTVVYQETAT